MIPDIVFQRTVGTINVSGHMPTSTATKEGLLWLTPDSYIAKQIQILDEAYQVVR